MQDILLIFAIVVGSVSFIYGKSSYAPWALFVAAFFFFIAGIGILQTGWETYDGASFTRTINSSTLETYTFTPVTTLASLSGDADNQLLFLAGNLFIVFTFAFIAMGAWEASKNRDAKQITEE